MVVEYDTSLRVLNIISAVSVCIGFIVGLFVLRKNKAVEQSDDAEDIPDGSDVSNPIQTFSTSADDNSVTSDSTSRGLQVRISDSGWNVYDRKTVKSTEAGSTTFQVKVKQKMLMFRKQLGYLGIALQSGGLFSLLCYWVFGNAVFMVRIMIIMSLKLVISYFFTDFV